MLFAYKKKKLNGKNNALINKWSGDMNANSMVFDVIHGTHIQTPHVVVTAHTRTPTNTRAN